MTGTATVITAPSNWCMNCAQPMISGTMAEERAGRDIASVLAGHAAAAQALVNRPQAGRGELQEVPVGVAEIDALASALPGGAALDRDVVAGEARLPASELVLRDREGDVKRTRAVMRRNGAARHVHGLERAAAREQEQHVAVADRECAHAAVL